ncbi:thrombospondin type 3 repeat-containing protein [Opitutus sp. ER46]|uniref:thrombospondin type 3 repeat-containing protein n=1 Tax=Opitutus sp. ER46 TaxID=2161864 RepID=UPI000D31FD1F|nr:thrombospondin type 3 repeat-containing protein [Opitutus sp. ER46]PTX94390.1 pectate lyase [Opitutus sp. ER46]
MKRVFALVLLSLAGPAFAAPIKVDLSVGGRADALAPGYAAWCDVTGKSAARRFGGVEVQLGVSHGVMATTWWKGGAVEGARMVVDAVRVNRAAADAVLELRLRGLPAGRHSLATFHNVSASPESNVQVGAFDVWLNGVEYTRGVKPSLRAASDDDAAVAYLEFEVVAGEDVRVEYRVATGAEASASLVLCGFELDGADPRRRAAKPQPERGDEHVAAEQGTVRLTWTPAPGAITHRVYLGTSEVAVAAATPDAPECHGVAPAAQCSIAGLDVHSDYFWRVDEIDAQGRVTPGEVWHFRLRRPAFPGAEGYGRFARGGRGGRVIEVTNLNDSGPGSLRAAVEADGPRTVVFAVSGLITLQRRLVIRNPYLTIAGQTAPGKGITLRKYNFGLMGTHDVVLRHLRVRPGNLSGTTLDGMGMATSDHCIIDHASISWTIDEAFSSRGARNITLQRTLISEALNQAGHKNYPAGSRHGYAASIGGMVGSFHHNLLAHNSGRNWSLAGGLDQAGHHTGWLDLRNNVVYNWDNRTTDGGAARVQYVNNYYKPGPASHVFHLLKPERNNIRGFGPQDYFVAGNVMEGRVGPDDAWGGIVAPDPARARRSGDNVADHDDALPSEPEPLASFVRRQPFFEPLVTTQSARAAYKQVLSDVGCTQPAFDAHDARIVREVQTGTFTYRGSKTKLPGLPDSQDDVGGWEEYPEVRRPADFDHDHDGLPDWWEVAHGTNPLSPAGASDDANADPDRDGYTNLEDYLNWMAAPHLECASDGSVTVDLASLTAGFTAQPVHRVVRVRHGTASVLDDGHTLRFVPEPGYRGLAEVVFGVTDADGDGMERTIGVAVR